MVHTFIYRYSAMYVLLKLHDLMVPLSPLFVPFPKGEEVSSVPDTAHLVPCLLVHPCIFGEDVLLISSPLVPDLLLQFFLPWMCNCSGFCPHGGHGAHIYM